MIHNKELRLHVVIALLLIYALSNVYNHAPASYRTVLLILNGIALLCTSFDISWLIIKKYKNK